MRACRDNSNARDPGRFAHTVDATHGVGRQRAYVNATTPVRQRNNHQSRVFVPYGESPVQRARQARMVVAAMTPAMCGSTALRVYYYGKFNTLTRRHAWGAVATSRILATLTAPIYWVYRRECRE